MFKKIESTDSGGLPFFNVWQKTLKVEQIKQYVDTVHFALSVKEAISGKGFLLSFEMCSVFVWKHSTHGKILESLFDEEYSTQFALQIKPTKKGLNFDLGIMDDVVVYHKLNSPEGDTITFITEEEKLIIDEEKRKNQELRDLVEEKNKKITKNTMNKLKKINPPIAP